jgi:hypothetical protein
VIRQPARRLHRIALQTGEQWALRCARGRQRRGTELAGGS